MSSLQTIYDSAIKTGNKCYISTTQPRSDGNFALSSVKRKLADLKDSIINRFGSAHTLNFWDGPLAAETLARLARDDGFGTLIEAPVEP